VTLSSTREPTRQSLWSAASTACWLSQLLRFRLPGCANKTAQACPATATGKLLRACKQSSTLATCYLAAGLFLTTLHSAVLTRRRRRACRCPRSRRRPRLVHRRRTGACRACRSPGSRLPRRRRARRALPLSARAPRLQNKAFYPYSALVSTVLPSRSGCSRSFCAPAFAQSQAAREMLGRYRAAFPGYLFDTLSVRYV